jgi:hypothetical protein
MKRTRKTEAAGVSRQSIWRRIVNLFRDDHDRLLVANVTAFNEPRIYLPPDLLHHCVWSCLSCNPKTTLKGTCYDRNR